VNGERIAEYAPLEVDDEIAIAGFRLRVHAGTASPQRRDGGLPGAAPRPADAADGDAADAIPPTGGAGVATAPACVDDLVPWRRLLHRRLLATIDLRRQDIRQLSAEQLHDEIDRKSDVKGEKLCSGEL